MELSGVGPLLSASSEEGWKERDKRMTRGEEQQDTGPKEKSGLCVCVLKEKNIIKSLNLP